MASCCSPGSPCNGTNTFFTRWSRYYAKRFRAGGLEPVQKYLLDGIGTEPVTGRSVLDIGCGVGSLHLTLLQRGAATSVGVDLSEGMLREARSFADTLGLSQRTEYLNGDFAVLAPTIPESDITVLDKVVCCYEDLHALVTSSTCKTKRLYALSHPKENIIMKSLFKGHKTLAGIFGWSFHPFWHNWDEMKSLIVSQGFTLTYERSTLAWQVLVFRRS
jgi:2-polyprenyl-3-methyl-5-hydroxy-6-metoxy-1,4-benzoquinol methylase